jgi:hypothetical protein
MIIGRALFQNILTGLITTTAAFFILEFVLQKMMVPYFFPNGGLYVLKIVGKFEGSTQHIIQKNEGKEVPSVSRITVLRDGLMDDSVRGVRWEIALEKTADNVWQIMEVRRSWRCWRGEKTNMFTSKLCP